MATAWLIGFTFGKIVSSFLLEYQDYTSDFVTYCLKHIDPLEVKGLFLACLGVLYLVGENLFLRKFGVFIIGTLFSIALSSAPLSHGLLAQSSPALLHLRQSALKIIERSDHDLAGWIDSIVWGETKAISMQLREAFKIAGIYHILSVSGSHVTTLVILLRFAAMFPLRLLYIVRLISGHTWTCLRFLVPLLCIPILLAYLEAIGSPQAAARATFLAITHQLSYLMGSSLPPGRRILLTISTQSFVLPEEFFSCGNFMSWMGYLCILEFAYLDIPTRSMTHWAVFRHALTMQVELLAWSVVCFGQLSLIGLFANFLLPPIFVFVFWAAVGLAICPEIALHTPAPLLQRYFLWGVKEMASLAERWPWLYWSGEEIQLLSRVACAVGCFYLLIQRLIRFEKVGNVVKRPLPSAGLPSSCWLPPPFQK